jgi:deoxyribose-phosphate aldolase
MQNLASFIEHTNLTPTLTGSDIDRLVAEAKQYSFLGICVPPFWVKRAKREIGDSKIFLVTVAGFPLGYSQTETKLTEIKHAIDQGVDEIDVVWNISAFKSHLPWTKIEIAKCSKLTHDHQKTLKVTIETAYLSNEEIVEACFRKNIYRLRFGRGNCRTRATHAELCPILSRCKSIGWNQNQSASD